MVEDVASDRSDEVAPETAFSLLTDEIRIEIIRALGHTPGYTATFSTLQERVGIADSGLFNYHFKSSRTTSSARQRTAIRCGTQGG